VNHEGDLFRTRLTHTLEVAQIARTTATLLKINPDLTEAIALAHDLGHTPFGHSGQTALDRCMADFGGFEHNLQSLRIVDLLEDQYPNFDGLNLTWETREGILKHCSRENALRLGALGERFLKGEQPSLEAQLVNIADAIAYSTHDIDDGLRVGYLDEKDLIENVPLYAEYHAQVDAEYPDIQERRKQKEVVRRLIGYMVDDLVSTSRANIEAEISGRCQSIEDAADFFLGRSARANENFEEHFNGQALPSLPRLAGGRKVRRHDYSALPNFCAFPGASAAALSGTVQAIRRGTHGGRLHRRYD